MTQPKKHALRAFREAHNPPLSQAKLARMLGVARETVTRWELGARDMDDDFVRLIIKKTPLGLYDLRPQFRGLRLEAAD